MTSDCPGTTAPASMPFRVTMASTNARGSAPSAAASAIDQTVSPGWTTTTCSHRRAGCTFVLGVSP